MSDTEPTPVALVKTYLEHLENDEFDRAAAVFDNAAVYIHPPTYIDSPIIEGREALLAYFRDERGTRAVNHEIRESVTEGTSAAMLGTSTGPDVADGPQHFIAYTETHDGLITYYAVGHLPAK